MALQRLQIILARAGISSRRHAEALIVAGRVRVNHRVANTLGTRADANRDRIEVDGRRVVAECPMYVLLHKPREVVSTLADPEGRPTVAGLVSGAGARLFPVGRLDYQTSGALLLTNDGDFASALLHPSHRVPKTYLVKVRGEMKEADIARWSDGVELEDGRTARAEVRVTQREPDRTWLEVVLHEGRNQQIRRMARATGFEVSRLTRLAFAGITIAGLRAGGWRLLTADELRALRERYGVPRRLRPAITASREEPRVSSRGSETRRGRQSDRTSPRQRRGSARPIQSGARSSGLESGRAGKADETRKKARTADPTQRRSQRPRTGKQAKRRR